MDALELLHTRVSSPRLVGQVEKSKLDHILRAALRAPDHAQLRPWRFLIIEGKARDALGELFVQANLAEDPATGSAALAKVKHKPLRAPLVVVAITCICAHPKVPEVEQVLSTGAAVQNMLLAAYAQGVGAMWRSGSMARNSIVHQGLGLKDNESIAAFVYLGEPEGKAKSVKPLVISDFVAQWTD